MNNKKKLLSMITLALMGSSGFAADCVLDETKDGWTGTVKFHCNKDTDLLENPISFKVSNNVEAGSIWGLPGKSTVSKNRDTVSVTVEKWWPQGEGYILPAGQSTTISFSPTNVSVYDSNYAPEFSIENFNVGGGSAQEQGTVTVTLPSKPSFITDSSTLANVLIYKGDTKVGQINDAAWGSTVNLSVPTGALTVSVPAIDGGAGSASPANLTLAQGETASVEISYETPAPAEVGSINLSASTSDAPEQNPAYIIKNSSGIVVAQGTINFNSPITISDLQATESGTKYTISVDGYSKDGYKYEAAPVTTTVTKFNSTDVNLTFEKEAIPTENVNIKVSGLATDNAKDITLTLANENGEKQEVTLNSNKDYNTAVPKDGSTWTVTATSVSGYTVNVSPSTFTANENSQNIEVTFKQQSQIESNGNTIGYWENWKGAQQAPAGTSNSEAEYYSVDVAPYSHVFYSFLTLAKSPNPDNPSNSYWDGSAIYESMTAGDVLEFMKVYPAGTADWERKDNWMRQRVDGLIEAVHNNNAKFIWAIGGWSDIQQTIREDQIDTFVKMVVDLLKKSGDGVDFDWEHLSQLANGNVNPNKDQQLATLAKTLLKLRTALDAAGMQDKEIGYTTRFNAFMADSSKYGFAGFNSDGEGLAIDNWLKAHGSSLDEVVDHVNIMAYDVGPSYMPNGQTWNMNVYKDVLDTFSSRVNKAKVNLGFEPGGQAAGGLWEGMDVSKQAINYLASNSYGGSMFWAINQTPYITSDNTGLNSDVLAKYTQEQYDSE
ncbi:hypothetical protein [Candidatus Francisella endociliophora]|uniref:hypothetical protein n=1 Tax=Candidatus Francisella endociliophora TaxID=653937 RepID=UPI000A92329F|nr:hypothetical protein [Francisella sp. FSC1006]